MPQSVSSRRKTKKTPVNARTEQPSTRFIVENSFQPTRDPSTLPIFVVSTEDYATWVNSAPTEIQSWLRSNHFKAKPGACALLPQADGCAGAVITVGDPTNPWEYAGLSKILPTGSFEAEPELEPQVAHAFCLGWLLSAYSFTRYKAKATPPRRTLVWPEDVNRELLLALGEGICLARDLINTPASDLGPQELEDACAVIAKRHGAKMTTIVGEALIQQNYPMIHAVGRASTRAPRLIDLRWGSSKHPRLTLVGKGVCFDTGGLDLKPAAFMKLMKKDMGGAAFILGLAHTVMSQNLPVQLRVLIPAVENSVSGNAMRPLDVLHTRKGITVEVGDTDAEGRLILGDALYEAIQDRPDLVVDAATLTGAARVALGPEVPAVFANFDQTWNALFAASETTFDPLWRLPLFDGYRRKLDSKIADISSISPDPYAGAIVAGLFLREFVTDEQDWIHIDTMGFNLDARPGRPYGGEALGFLATFDYLRTRYQAVVNTPQQSDAPKLSSPSKKAAGRGKAGSATKKTETRASSKVSPGGKKKKKTLLH